MNNTASGSPNRWPPVPSAMIILLDANMSNTGASTLFGAQPIGRIAGKIVARQ